ncbi:MAG: helix-turn-helix transcriptional regulator [Pseudomonadota bacterium]
MNIENEFGDLIENYTEQAPGFFYAKDKTGKYIYTNEEFAMFADCDSPNQLKNKRDNDLPWRDQARFLQSIDHRVISSSNYFQEFINIHHPKHGTCQFLTTKKCLYDIHNSISGVIGMSVCLTGKKKFLGKYYFQDGRLYLGDEFATNYLTSQEIRVYKTVLMGYSAKEAGVLLKISGKTVEFHIEQLRKKINCNNKGELIRKAYEHCFSFMIINHQLAR